MAYCRYCGKEITWLKDGRKSIPVESDGAKHECEEFMNSRKSLKKMDRGNLDPELIKQYEEAINKKK
jgi:hypothetical protein